MILGRHQKFSAVSLTISDFVNSQSKYIVPVFQRSYSWGSSQVIALLQDLFDLYCLKDDQKVYSLGTIVCDNDDSNKTFYLILDGQQRLTTLDLLLSFLRESQKKQYSRHIISAYRYLDGFMTAEDTPLPECESQKRNIRSFFESDERKKIIYDDQNFFENFERWILTNVSIVRVIIPLSENVSNEAPMIFEIINMRGQKLTELDQLKARLLSLLGEDVKARSYFNGLWVNAENIINDPNKAVNGLVTDKKESDEDTETSLSRSLTISEIDEIPFADKFELKQPNSDDETVISNQLFHAPVDFSNLLVIANEILKYMHGEQNTQALTTKRFYDRFNWIMTNPEKGKEYVWQLMSITTVLVQVVAHWGIYRDSDGKFNLPFTQFSQLVLSFMAANSYQASGQYWLLVLGYIALKRTNLDSESLPKTEKEFSVLKPVNFKFIEKDAFRLLMIWARKAAYEGMEGGTEKVFNIIDLFDKGLIQNELNDQPMKVDQWRYDGDLRQWSLYWVDYLLWVDYVKNNCVVLKTSMDHAEDCPKCLSQALKNFDFDEFRKRMHELRIVSRGAIEHWLARDRADLLGDKDKSEQELRLRHGFGNLALIDASANSSLGKQLPKGKAQEVLEMSNPAPKLLWLALLRGNKLDQFAQFDNPDAGMYVPFIDKVWERFLNDMWKSFFD